MRKETNMPHSRTPMSLKIDALTKKGYDKEFHITEEGLVCYETGDTFSPEDVNIIEKLRFEGISDPDDMAIVYIIETKNGLKGTVVDAFGLYSDDKLISFMGKAGGL
ncbi:hypothetical protein RCC89_00095 [Cytophagaceae bacterium ABcell3]|nr:hypothetical protein RCC89_00095 [Cytophagaceae bacterium ABcell3]